MKAFVVTGFVLALLQFASAQNEEERQFYPKEEGFTPEEKACINELNINVAELEAIIKEITRYLPEDNEVFNKFLNCFWVKAHFQDQNGAIIYENLIKLLKDFPRFKFGANSENPVGEEIARQAVGQCTNVPAGNSHGQTATRVQNCVTKHIVELIK